MLLDPVFATIAPRPQINATSDELVAWLDIHGTWVLDAYVGSGESALN